MPASALRLARARLVRERARRDDAVSEVVGTILLTAIAVTLVAGFGLVALSTASDAAQPPTGAFALSVEEGDRFVDVTFVSGSPFPVDHAAYAVTVDGESAAADHGFLTGTPPLYRPGDVLRVNLTADAPDPEAGMLVRLFVVHKETGKLVGSASRTVTGEPAPPAFATAGAPLATDPTVTPASLRADGETEATVSVRVQHPLGLALIRSVTADLSHLGGPSVVPLRDDGALPDERGGDGTFTGAFTVPRQTYDSSEGTKTVQVPLTVTDALGKTMTVDANVTVTAEPASKVTAGARWRDLPPSDSVGSIHFTNFWFRDDPERLANDEIVILVSDLQPPGPTWEATVRFGYDPTCPGSDRVVESVTLTRNPLPVGVPFTEAVYTPVDCYPLEAATDIVLSDPRQEGNWDLEPEEADMFRYADAGIRRPNEAVVTYFGDVEGGLMGLRQADLEWYVAGAGLTASVSPSPSEGVAPLDVTFTLTASSPDAAIASWTLDYDDGNDASGAGAPPATTTHQYADLGVYTVTFTVEDDAMNTVTHTATVTVTAPEPPTASVSASPSTGTAPLEVTFTLTANADAGTTLQNWTLDYGDGNSTLDDGEPPATAVHTYTDAGTFTVTFGVTDAFGASTTVTDTVVVTVLPNEPPTASLDVAPEAGTVPLDVTFTLDAEDPDGEIASWSLDFGDGSEPETGDGDPPATLPHQYAARGAYTATLEVTDDEGATASATADVTVADPPTASLDASPASGVAPLDVTFTLTASADAFTNLAGWTLDPGDGSPVQSGSGAPPATHAHTYATPGVHTATLEVTDGHGATATDTATVTVSALTYVSTTVTDLEGGTVASPGNMQSPGPVATLTEEEVSEGGILVPEAANARTFDTGVTGWVRDASLSGHTGTISWESTMGQPPGSLQLMKTQGGGGLNVIAHAWTLTEAHAGDATFTMDYWFAGSPHAQRHVTVLLEKPDGSTVTLVPQTPVGTGETWFTATNPTVSGTHFTEVGETYRLLVYWNGLNNNDHILLDNIMLAWDQTGTHRFGKQLQVPDVPAGAGFTHTLEIGYRVTTNPEGLRVLTEGPGGTWTERTVLTSTTPAEFTRTLTADELVGGNVNLRLVDNVTDADALASSWEIDYIRVRTVPS